MPQSSMTTSQLTLQQSRRSLGYVFDQDLAATIDDEAVERRGFRVGENGIARFCDAILASPEELDSVS